MTERKPEPVPNARGGAGEGAARAACGPVRKSTRTKWRLLSWGLVHLFIIGHAIHWLTTGSTLSPLEPSESMQTLEGGAINAGFLIFGAAILLTAIFGRFFCGWACHLIAYQDGATMLLEKLGFRPRPFRSRLLVWVPIGAAFYMFVWPSFSRVLAGVAGPRWAFHLQTENFWATFPGLWISILSVVVCGVLVVVFLGNKGFCTYACPYGAFFSHADRLAPGKIVASDACNACGHCTVACSSNIRVHEEVKLHRRVTETGCMKCLDCVSVCPMNALSYKFTRPELGRAKGPRPARRYDLSWPEEILVAALFLGALYAFRGLYDLIPFLLSLGIAACTAYLVWLWIRAWRAPYLVLQTARLRDNGRFTRGGVGFQAFVSLLLVLTAHSAWVNYRAHEASYHIAAAGRAPDRAGLEREAHAAVVNYQFCIGHGLVDVAGWRLGLGSAQAALGMDADAERNLRRAIELDPKLARAHLSLADLRARHDDLNGAIEELYEAARLDPEFALDPYLQTVLANGDLPQLKRGLALADERLSRHPDAGLTALRDLLAHKIERDAAEH